MTTDETPQRRLSLRILLLLIFAAALSPVLVIGGIRWSSDIEREAQYRRETMTLVARVAASRAESDLLTAPGLLQLDVDAPEALRVGPPERRWLVPPRGVPGVRRTAPASGSHP